MPNKISINHLGDIALKAQKNWEKYQAEIRSRATLSFQSYICLYIDILGTREMFSDTEIDPIVIEQFFGAIEQFESRLRRVDRHGDLIMKTYTDNMFAAIPLDAKSTKSSADRVFGFLYEVIGYLQWVLSVCQLPLKGGIVTGSLVSNKLFGPGAIAAVDLEQNAQYPRILIDEHTLEFLSPSLASPEIRYFIEECGRHPMLYKADDGHTSLDYLAGTLMPIWLKSHKEFVGGNLEKYCDNDKVRSKYEWLMKYHTDAQDYLHKAGMLRTA